MLQKQIPATCSLIVNSSYFEAILPRFNIESSSFVWTPSMDGDVDYNKTSRYIFISNATPITYGLDFSYLGVLRADCITRLKQLQQGYADMDVEMTFANAWDEAVNAFSDKCKFKAEYWFTTRANKNFYDIPTEIAKVTGLFESSSTVAFTQSGSQITLTDTPKVARKHKLVYFGKHIVNSDSAYEHLDDAAVGIILLRAQANVLREKASKVAEDAWKYTLADESLDKTGQAPTLLRTADSFDVQFNDRIKSYQGLAIASYVRF